LFRATDVAVCLRRAGMVAVCAAGFGMSGCVATSSEIAGLRGDIAGLKGDLNGLKADLSGLKTEITQLKRNQADINARMELLDENLRAYTEKLENNRFKMSLLAQRMDDVHASLTQRMDILSRQLPKVDGAVLPVPTELFQVSYNDYARGMYNLAIRGFRDYLERYPDSELAPKAFFYIADAYLSRKQYQDCLKTVEAYLRQFPADELVPSMLYRKVQSLRGLSDHKQADEVAAAILKSYPTSKEAQSLRGNP